jgi:hypothetical protein
MSRRIAAITIGAAPRPDLVDPLRAAVPSDVRVVEYGALDGWTGEPPPPTPGGYPLTTRAADGHRIVADEAWLAPRVAAAVARAEADGALLSVLLCAGGFDGIPSVAAIVRPFELAVELLQSLAVVAPGVLVPDEGQIVPSRDKWIAAGFEPTVRAGSPDDLSAAFGFDADETSAWPVLVVLDYVGHAGPVVEAARRASPVPIVDLGSLAPTAVAATMRR